MISGAPFTVSYGIYKKEFRSSLCSMYVCVDNHLIQMVYMMVTILFDLVHGTCLIILNKH